MVRSERFDDIYFSPKDGVAESVYVFLEGNGATGRFKDRERFTIAETGFGTGLNFILAAGAFDGAALDYWSFEKYPLSVEEIERVLTPILTSPLSEGEGALSTLAKRGDQEGGEFLIKLLKSYPLRIPGFHQIEINNIRLILIFDDVNKAIPQMDAKADAWFLDGFAPAKNPEMWTDALFANMARLSDKGATFATFTAAGHVRRGLESAGFTIEKIKGFGKKKHMIKGVYGDKDVSGAAGRDSGSPLFKRTDVRRGDDDSALPAKSVAIIGAGLAGTSCAWLLKKHGIHATIFEASDNVAGGASGNAAGIFNPRFSAGRTPESDFYASAYALAIRTMREIQESFDIGYRRLGTLHLVNSPEKEKRFRSVARDWGWHADHLRYVHEDEASRIAGVKIPGEALYLPDSGSVSPLRLCAAYAEGIDVRLNTQLMKDDIARVENGWRVLGREYDAVILACGEGAKWFDETGWLPVHTVRGQIVQAQDSGFADDLACNICYGGYISPGADGAHTLGSTFQKWLTHTDILEADNDEIIGRLKDALPDAREAKVEPTDARAGLRTSAQDRFPIAGTVPDLTAWKLGQDKDVPGLYLTTAHGSHGIVSSIAAAQLVTDQILGRPPGMSVPVVESLNAARFLKRARKRGRLGDYSTSSTGTSS